MLAISLIYDFAQANSSLLISVKRVDVDGAAVGVAIGVSVVVSVSVGAANAGVVIASASNIADAVFITLFIIISPFPNITLVYIYQF